MEIAKGMNRLVGVKTSVWIMKHETPDVLRLCSVI